jgi:hypothetical protein
MEKYEFLAGLGLPPQMIAILKANEARRGPTAGGAGSAPHSGQQPQQQAQPKQQPQPQPQAALNGPMLPNCKPIKGKVPGPANHLLCATHGHVVDVKSMTIIALSLDQYKAAKTAKPDGKARADGAGSKSAASASTTSASPSSTSTTSAAAPSTMAAAPAASATAAPPAAANPADEAKKVIKLIQIEVEDFAGTVGIYADWEKENSDGLLNRAVSGVSHLLGDAKDPGGALSKMQFQMIAEETAGMKAASEQNIAEARKHLAAAHEIAENARKLVMAYTTDTSGAERAVTGLKVADKAGDYATTVLGAVAPPVGEGLSLAKKGAVVAMKVHLGDKVNWGEFAADVACELFFDKVGGGDLAKRVGGPVTEKLVAKYGKKVSKEFIEKEVEEVISHEMKTVVTTTAEEVYDAAKGKDITYEEFLSHMVDKMTDPQELLMTMVSSKVQVAVEK